MAAIHDLPEIITDDIDYVKQIKEKIKQSSKEKIEHNAYLALTKYLRSDIRRYQRSLFEEYQKRETPESKFVNAADRLETMITLLEAGHKTYKRPELIPNYADAYVYEIPKLVPFLLYLKSEFKKEFKKGKIKWDKKYDNHIRT